MKKIIIYIILFTSLISCNDWLNVKPTGSIVDDELFGNEAGYKQALTGAYIGMMQPQLYGQNLLLGLTDAMAKYWKIDLKSNVYYDIYNYDFKTKIAEEQIGGTWRGMYSIIANLNLLLERLEDAEAKDYSDYKLIKGEALGLRAYLHLDILRLFGPVIDNNTMELKSIPYRTVNINKIVKFMKTKDVLASIEKDLKNAYNLLKDDPIKKYGRKSASNVYIDKENMAYEYRSIRMNYYAVAASLARYYLLINNKEAAYEYAKEVIDANKTFGLLKRDDIIKGEGQRDLMFEREIIFGLYDVNLKNKLGVFLGYGERNTPNLSVDESFLDKIYIDEGYGKPDDYRRAYWWKDKSNYKILYKYFRSLKEDETNPYDPIFTLIRLSEMFYIASEAKVGKDNGEAIDLLNQVRISRNLDPLDNSVIVNDEQLLSQILAEYRKDFWGEGQLVYTYKRFNSDVLTNKGIISADMNRFVLPIPKEEYEFGNN